MPTQYLKLEEVGEQVRLNQWQIDHRSSLLAVMLHHTIDHSSNDSWNGDAAEEEEQGEEPSASGGLWEEGGQVMDTTDTVIPVTS